MPSSREVSANLKRGGWYEVGGGGTGHRQLKHPTKSGRVTVPHPVKDLEPGTLKSIERQSGLKLRWAMATVRHYPAIVEAGDEPGFGVFFPDLPGCVSAGATIQEAAAHAEEALALHLGGMVEDGEPLPEPTPLDRLPADPEVHEVTRLLVRAEVRGRPVRINITFDEGLLAAVDRAARTRGFTRSGFLAEAARRLLAAR